MKNEVDRYEARVLDLFNDCISKLQSCTLKLAVTLN